MPDLSEGQELLLVLWLLYLSDCFCWVRRTAVLFTAPFCRKWSIAKPSAHLGNLRGNLCFLNPLPPFGEAITGSHSPFAFSPDGICGLTLAAGGEGRVTTTGPHYSYEQIEKLQLDGADLLVNGQPFAACATPLQARELAELIRHLQKTPQPARAGLIDRHLRARLSKSKAKRALKLAQTLGWDVRTWCLLFFVIQYGMIPAFALVHDLRVVFLPAAGVYLLGAWSIGFWYFRAHRRLFPDARGERIGNVVKMCGCPPLALRAADLITLPALSSFHPLVLAHVLEVPRLAEYGSLVARDLRHPLRHQLSGRALAVAQWHADAERAAAERYLKTEGVLDPAKVYDAPDPVEDCTKYCPRCRSQFRTDAEHCSDCKGVPLKAFALEPEKATAGV